MPELLILEPLGHHLVGRVVPDRLGFRPERVWNPSPTVYHRTEPWPVPKTLVIHVVGHEDTAARFSPPPFAVTLLGGGRQALVAVAADAGWHRWNWIQFEADAAGLTVGIDFEGHTDPVEAAAHVRMTVVPGAPGESGLALLARGLAGQYPAASDPPARPILAWWPRPSYCGWGDQVAIADLEQIARAWSASA